MSLQGIIMKQSDWDNSDYYNVLHTQTITITNKVIEDALPHGNENKRNMVEIHCNLDRFHILVLDACVVHHE